MAVRKNFFSREPGSRKAAKSTRGLWSVVLLLSLWLYVGVPTATSATTGSIFIAERFFAGHLDGVGRLSILMRHAVSTHVTSTGHVAADGTLFLDQHVEQQGKPSRDRHWAIRPLGAGRYAGTLTDASGPVRGEARGSRLHLTYPMRGGLRVDQWLTLTSDGRAAENHMIVRKLGMVVAKLDEMIRKIP